MVHLMTCIDLGKEILDTCPVISQENWSAENRANIQKETNQAMGDGGRASKDAHFPVIGMCSSCHRGA